MAQDTILDTLVINEMSLEQYKQHKQEIGAYEMTFLPDVDPEYVAEFRTAISGLTTKMDTLYDDYLNASSLL